MMNHTKTDNRRGERLGWIGGWLGSFIWLAVLSLVWIVTGQTGSGLIGFGFFGIGVLTVFLCSPWKHPGALYWKLMIPVYAMLFGAAGFAVSVTGFGQLDLKWWSVFWVCPLLTPLWTVGRRRWDESHPGSVPNG